MKLLEKDEGRARSVYRSGSTPSGARDTPLVEALSEPEPTSRGFWQPIGKVEVSWLRQGHHLGARIALALTLVGLGLMSSCAAGEEPPPDVGEGRFRLTVEEAGFLVKGELFRLFGESADPVMVDVAATKTDVDRQPAWRLTTVIHIQVDGQIEERYWRFWVGLDEGGAPAVLRAEEISGDQTGA